MTDAYIKIDNITKAFGEKQVLCGVTLEMERNESAVIIGRSGCGKSVFLKHLNGLIHPDSGAVYVYGKDIAKLSLKELVEVRKNIGMLFQSAALLDSLTVGENVGLALHEVWRYPASEIEELVEEKLQMVGLEGTGALYPSSLSGGMRKRVGLARAIATEPQILLYDEPTTGLDPVTADMINDLIIEIHEKLKVTSVTVTHDMRTAYKVGQRIVMLHDGRIVFEGTPDQAKYSNDSVVRQFIEGRASGPSQVQ